MEHILRKLAQNISPDEIISDHPQLTLEDIQAALVYAAEALSTEEIFILETAQT